jgi:polysaccharide deacetylase family protein (PEP-CTERM system associated)
MAMTAPLPPGADIFSVDVEDYFHVEAFTGVIARRDWDGYACRVEANTTRLLDLLDEAGITATFFILGWVAERYPRLVREIVARGHEPACHSYWHRLIHTMDAAAFREDTLRAKTVIEQAAGARVDGYRAPSFSITRRTPWALEVLADAGFAYDSSIFPIRHDVYGIPDAPRRPFRVATPSGPLIEYPMTTFRLVGRTNLPVGGGGYLRILPFWYTRLGLARLRRERVPLVTYVHPWEIDAEQPRVAAPLKARLRHYTNLPKMATRLRALSRLGTFTTHRAALPAVADTHEVI